MAVVADTQQAVAILDGIQGRLEDSGDVALSQQVAVMIKLLDSPSFKQLLNLQQAIRQLKDHISATPPGKQSTDFDFSPDGELVLPHEEPKEESEPESPGESHPFAFENVTFQPDEETITPTVAHDAASAPTLPARSSPMWIAITDPRLTELAFNRELVAVDLIKPESGGLGFTVVGLNSKTHGDLGIFIQKIQPESVAARDGRLRESDQILVINDQILDAGVSHKDAIGMLHKIQGQVYMIIARGDFDLPPPSELQPMEQPQQEEEDTDQAEIESDGIDEVDTTPEIRTIELTNDGNGLGFGIVGVHNTGIVVKTIVKDGVAARDGRLESGDIILQIGDTSLKGMNSTEVASVLRQSGSHVKLTVVKKGISVPPQQLRMPLSEEPKVEKLEETQEEAAPPLPVTSPPPDVAVDTPKIDLEVFEVELQKTSQGLGLSIAGFEENRPDGVEAGIFVKGIADGSAAALSQKIRVGDQIIEVDSQPVHGFGNRQAVELLRRTGSLVHLKLARRKRRNNTSIDVPTTIPEKETEMELENAEPKDDEKMKVQQPEEIGETDVAREEEDKDEEEEDEEEEEEKTDKEKEEISGEEGKEDNEGDDIGMELDEQLEAAAVAGVMAAVVMEEKKEDEPRIEEDEMEEPTPIVTPVVIEQQKADQITYPKTSPAMASRKDPSVQIALWQSMLGPMVTILVSDVKKDGSLGIVLEGRVDIDEHGQEIQPRHYISTVVSDGPVGKQGLLAPGDELLEVNGIRLYGRNHEEVVDILRSLPSKVHLICGRHDRPPMVIKEDLPSQREAEEVIPEVVPHVESARLPIGPEPEVKESVEEEEEGAQAVEETLTVVSGDSVSLHSDTPSGMSHESLMGVSVWSDQVQLVTLHKGDQGLGFSILDYQDPLKPENNVILIRSLVDGGIAEQDGRLIPGDRLMSVNDIDLESATLEAAVEAVRSAPQGYVKIGVAKPLPSSIIEEQREALAQQTKEEEDKRRTIDQEAPVVAMTTSVAHAVAPRGRTNPPDLIADGPPKPAPRKSLSNSPPPEPSHPPPSLPAPTVVTSASITLQQRPTYIELPESLEKTLVLKNTSTGLGMTVSADQANGAIVKSILRGGCIHEDGTLSVGDNITAINGDSTRNMSNSSVRGLLRKCFFGGSEISITYISASDAAAYRDQLAGNLASPDSEEEMWQDIRVVEVYREPGKSLGISILGGRVGQGFIDGIFIKHVLEDSPAGKTGDLKTGDRILEVNDCDLREATHDQAVAIIKNAPNPVKFKVQSLSPELQPSYLSELDDESYQATMIIPVDEDQDKSDSDDVDADTKEISSASSMASLSESEEDEYGYSRKIIASRYEDYLGEYFIFEVQKTGSSLGLSLAGNKDSNIMSAFVVGINPETAAAHDGRIMVADELMEINGIKVFGHTHREASMIIGEMPEGPIKLVVRRRAEAVQELAVTYVPTTPINQVPLSLRKPTGDVVVDLIDGGDLQEESGEADFSSFPNVHTITLHKGTTGLGFFIYEKKDHVDRLGIFVKEISHHGAAGQEGSLQVDDQILAVDDLSLIGLSKLSAISVLKATRGEVELTVSSTKMVTSANPYLTSQSESMEESIVEIKDDLGGPTLRAVRGASGTTADGLATTEDPKDLDSGPLTAPILQKTQTSIIIDRGSKSLGLKIAGGSDTDIPIITIDEVLPEGAADKDGRLNPGDQILAVNGVQLNNVTHGEALQVFRDIPPLVPMIVFRVESDASSTETWEELIIDLSKREGQGLGLSIVGKKDDRGVFISDIVIGGTAFRDGRLRRGDRLLAIDDQDVVNASKDQVAPMLRSAVGTVVLKVGRLTEDAAAEALTGVSPLSDEAGTPKEESLLSELMNDPQLDPAGGESGYSQDEEEEEEEVHDPGAPIQTVVLDRGPDGLGFSIVGGFGSPHGNLPIYIKTVFDRGAAAQSGVLKRGDQIVEVNGKNLSGVSHKEAVSVLKQVTGRVELKVISR